jgi:hypothetical protein
MTIRINEELGWFRSVSRLGLGVLIILYQEILMLMPVLNGKDNNGDGGGPDMTDVVYDST